MDILSKHVLLFILSFLFQATSSLYLADHRRPKMRTLTQLKNEHSLSLDPKTRKFDVSDPSRKADWRRNEKAEESRKTGTFVICIFNVDSVNQPEYDCKHSPDVKMNWTREDGRLIGSFSTSFHCPKRRDPRRDETPSIRYKVDGIWKQRIREKRGTVYRDDTEANDAQKEEAQQTDEDTAVVPEMNQEVTEDDEVTEDSQMAPAADAQKDVLEEDNIKEPDIKTSEDPKMSAEAEKAETGETKDAEGSEAEGDKTHAEEAGEEKGDVDDEKEPTEDDKEKNDKLDTEDKDVSTMETGDDVDKPDTGDKQDVLAAMEVGGGGGDGGDDDDDDNDDEKGDQDGEEAAEVKDSEDKDKEPIEDKEGDKTGDEVGKNEGVDDRGNESDAVKDNKNDMSGEKAKGDESDSTGTESDASTDQDNESMLVPIQIDIEVIITEAEFPLLTQLLQKLLLEAGDYLLSFLQRNLRQRLRHGRIEEKFHRKVESLARSHGNDTGKALLIVKKKIHEELGKPYQLQIVRYLKQLHQGFEQ